MQNEKVQTTNACIPKCENENLFTLANDCGLYKSLTAGNVNGYKTVSWCPTVPSEIEWRNYSSEESRPPSTTLAGLRGFQDI